MESRYYRIMLGWTFMASAALTVIVLRLRHMMQYPEWSEMMVLTQWWPWWLAILIVALIGGRLLSP